MPVTLTNTMGRIASLFAIWMVLNIATISASTSDHASTSQELALPLRVSTSLPVQPSSLPAVPPVVNAAVNVYPYRSTTVIVTTIIYIRTCSLAHFLPSPPTSTVIPVTDVQCTATVTQCDSNSKSGVVAKQTNTAAGVAGGFIGGSVIGFVLTVVITLITAILITKHKHHKKRERRHQSRALRCSSSVLADEQEIEQSYQDPLTLSIADDIQPEYDYINTENDQQPMIELTQCPAYRSAAQH